LPTAENREPTVYVIDLHRAQIRKKVPYRYHVKDVAGLLFSAWSAGLTRREALRFIREYSGNPLKKELCDNRKFWQDVENTAGKLYCKEHGKAPQFS
jgi:heptose I phosphotransferase